MRRSGALEAFVFLNRAFSFHCPPGRAENSVRPGATKSRGFEKNQIQPCLTSSTAACVRLATPILRKIRLSSDLIVSRETVRLVAIS